MSQTRKTLKKIASTDQYQALATAVKEDDYETIVSSYIKLSQLLEEAEREIEGKIQSLPRRNKGEDYKRFRTAFATFFRLHSNSSLVGTGISCPFGVFCFFSSIIFSLRII